MQAWCGEYPLGVEWLHEDESGITVWAIINGEARTGITLFSLEDGVDNGSIINQRETRITEDDTIATVYARIEDLELNLIDVCLPRMADGTARLAPQGESRRRVFPQRKPEDGAVDWHWPAGRIHNFVRAQTSLYPGAFIQVGGEKVIVWRAFFHSLRPASASTECLEQNGYRDFGFSTKSLTNRRVSMFSFSTIPQIDPAMPKTWPGKVFMCIDIGWASDKVLAHTLDRLEGTGAAATFFVTRSTPLLDRIRRSPQFELGIHPNSNSFLDQSERRSGDARTIVRRRLPIVPESKTVWSHSLNQSSWARPCRSTGCTKTRECAPRGFEIFNELDGGGARWTLA